MYEDSSNIYNQEVTYNQSLNFEIKDIYNSQYFVQITRVTLSHFGFHFMGIFGLFEDKYKNANDEQRFVIDSVKRGLTRELCIIVLWA